jgi:hypothetical protein
MPMDETVSDMICYCFRYTRRDIQEDIRRNERSLILEKIIDAKRLGACRCAVENPKGT